MYSKKLQTFFKLEFLLKQCPSICTKSSPLSSSNLASTTVNFLHPHHHHHHHHHHSNSSLKLTERSRSALIALIVLIVENTHLKNKFKQISDDSESAQTKQPIILNQELFNYLLSVLENLPNIKWVDDELATSKSNNSHFNKQSMFIFDQLEDFKIETK